MKRELDNLLKAADRSQQLHKTASLFCKLFKYMLLAFILILTMDIIWHWAPEQRISSMVIYAVILAGVGLVLSWQAFIKSRSLKSIAREIEDKDDKCGSRLINTLDLSEQLKAGKLQGVSAEIAEKAIEQYTEKQDLQVFRSALNPGTFGRQFKLAFASVALIILLLIPVRNVVQLELLRFFDPHGDHPAFSLTKLSISSPADDQHKVVYGKSLIVNALASGHQPDELFVSYHPVGQPDLVRTLPMFNKGELGFSQKIDNIKDELSLFVHTADKRSISKKRKVGLILTPRVEKATVTIVPPAYTGRKTIVKPYTFKNITALNGSEVRFSFDSNRPLKEGELSKISGFGEEQLKMNVKEESSVEGGFVVTENSRLRFKIVDVAGNESHELLKGSVTVTFDRAPSVSILTPEKDSYITEDFLLKVKFMANDDYGIKQMRLHRALNGFYGPPKVFEPEEKNIQSLTQVVAINIPTLGVVPGDIISLYADTVDNSPEGQAAITPVLHLQVVSVKEYNEYLRQQAEIDDINNKYEQMQERLTDLAQEQKKLNETMAKLKEQIKQGKADKKTQEKLNSLIQKQNEINSKIAKLADDLEKFGREQPLYDIENSFAKEMQKQAEELRDSVEENNSSLKEFSKNSDSKKQSPEQLADALQSLQQAGEKQKKNLDKRQEEYSDRVLKTLLDLSLMNAIVKDFNRFKYLYQMQTALTEKAKRFNVIRELSRADELALKKHAAEEKLISAELEKLVKDLRYHGEDAELQFPKASKSAIELADKIDQARLVPLADQAVNSMLIPDGPESYQLVERLRQEMKKFFDESGGMSQQPHEPNPYMKNEFDQYMSLMLGMAPGDTFEQMSQCRKLGIGRFGRGRNGRGGMPGGGSGRNGSDGSQIGLLGNEMLGGKENKNAQGDGKYSKGRQDQNGNEVVSIGQDRKESAINDRKIKGEAVTSESLFNEYDSLIDAYFEKITEEEK